jgi:hypothetical protein
MVVAARRSAVTSVSAFFAAAVLAAHAASAARAGFLASDVRFFRGRVGEGRERTHPRLAPRTADAVGATQEDGPLEPGRRREKLTILEPLPVRGAEDRRTDGAGGGRPSGP